MINIASDTLKISKIFYSYLILMNTQYEDHLQEQEQDQEMLEMQEMQELQEVQEKEQELQKLQDLCSDLS